MAITRFSFLVLTIHNLVFKEQLRLKINFTSLRQLLHSAPHVPCTLRCSFEALPWPVRFSLPFILFEELLPQNWTIKIVNNLWWNVNSIFLRKEVIQPHLPIRLPCYDFTPIIYPTLGGWLLTVTPPTSGVTNSRGVTGGVYKARERIHRGMLIRDY